MPPKGSKKPTSKSKQAEKDDSLSETSDLSEPVKKRAGKRKSDADKPAGSPKSETKKAAPKRAKKEVLTEPETTEQGWTLHPPALIYRSLRVPFGHLFPSFEIWAENPAIVQKWTVARN